MSKFEKGKSGNPIGRPKGVKDRRTMFRELVEPHKNELAQKAIDLALSGNEQMLRLLLDRLLPAKPKDNPLPDIGGLEGDLAEQGNKIIELVAGGFITPDEARNLFYSLTSKAQLVEVAALEKTVAAISKTLKLRGGKQ